MTTPIRLDENGLSIPGLLWHVDQFLDMKALQVKYRDSWHRLRKEKKRTVPPATTLYRATTHILFEIIAHLVRVGEKAVANAILNSTSDWTWRNTNSKTGAGMVESVDQFPPELRVENRKGMFSLDSSRKDGLGRNRDVEYRQCWIVDRVMEKGGFWIGSIVTDDFNPLDGANFHGPGGGKWIDGFSTDASSELVEAVANETIANETIAGELKPFEGDATDVPMTKASNLVQSQAILPESPLQVETKGRPMERIDYKSHSHRLTVTSMIEMLAGETIFRDSAPGHRITSESMGALAMGLSAPEDMTGRKAVFDLEPFKGNETLVITPYQRALESIPRPAMRSMSVSWVVEPSDGETQRQSMARFRVKAMVKGMWQFTTTFLGTYVLQ